MPICLFLLIVLAHLYLFWIKSRQKFFSTYVQMYTHIHTCTHSFLPKGGLYKVVGFCFCLGRFLKNVKMKYLK